MVLSFITKSKLKIFLPLLVCCILLVSCDSFKRMVLGDSYVVNELPEEKYPDPEVEKRLVVLGNKWAQEKDKTEKWYGAIISRDWRIHRAESGIIESKGIWAYLIGEREDGKCIYQEHYFLMPYYSGEFQEAELHCIGRNEYPNTDQDHQYMIDCRDLEKYK